MQLVGRLIMWCTRLGSIQPFMRLSRLNSPSHYENGRPTHPTDRAT
jgi:hypothetical protein